MAIFHAFDTGYDDEDLVDAVLPSDWDADHDSPAWLHLVWQEPDGQTWANQPAALTKFMGDDRTVNVNDLRWVQRIRIIVHLMTAGASGAQLRMQYSTDGSTWLNINADGGPVVSLAAIGLFASAWVTVVPGAQIEDCYTRVVGVNGNGVADPKFRGVWAHVI